MNHTGLDRQFHRRQTQRFERHIFGHAVDLEHHTARLDLAGPEVDRPLTFTHPNFGGLRGHRSIREDPDPDTTLTLHVTGHRTTRRLNLPRCDALGLGGFQTERPKVEIRTAFGLALDPTFVHLAEFCTLWL
ncbi:hypothetical protein ISM_01800 [Roseovarius nubinhibens ISM]|uniref:Uncharacterized protein n=1 Tax=Roseovarius nubinhibens (strain ATCC BAA-591 / DSM 15170 / ISM) TaxID=89187 RepID=A3SI02_ROSNI|nr:hypothetical protein ISM_01800 [Roseovarius nubinhibens ISM]